MRYLTIILLLAGCNAVQHPGVWGPAALAAALQINDLDEQISDELSENTPLFGSNDGADDWSDIFRDATAVSYVTAGAYIPEDSLTKTLLIGTQVLSAETVSYAGGELKDSIDRERPDGSDSGSMPSRHTLVASYQANLASANIARLDISTRTKRRLDFSVNTLAVMTGYARVEARKHYPSDVLIGWGLGNLFGYAAEGTVIMPSASKEDVNVVFSATF